MYKKLISIVLLLFIHTYEANAKLETFAQLSEQYPPGNIAISDNGRVFMSVHGFYGVPSKFVEVFADGSVKPYPSEKWSVAPQGNGPGLNGVLGVNIDRQGILWMLDGASANHAGRIVAWDTKTESLHRIIYLAQPIAYPDSFLNDLAVDREHEAIFVADTASPAKAAIIVIDLKTGQSRRLLEGHKLMQPDNADIKVDGKVVNLGGQPARIGINPITIDPSNRWVYFGAMSGEKIYRVKTVDLLDQHISQNVLLNNIEVYGDKPFSDGITVDNAGNVYVTDIENNAIGVVGSDGKYQILYQDEQLSWSDGFAVGPNNMIYVTINELHRSPVLNDGVNDSKGDFKIMKFKSLAEATTGR